jgi:hypothetical protein
MNIHRNDFPQRDVHTPGTTLVPGDLLQSIVVAELLRPSRPLWIVSPWISDVALVDNSARQFGAISPEWPAAPVRLTTVLTTLLERSGSVVIAVNFSPHNDELLRRLQPLQEEHGAALRVLRGATLHEKGIVGEHFVLDGSMNLTYNGVHVNDEHLLYRTDPAQVAERRLSLERHWGDQL